MSDMQKGDRVKLLEARVPWYSGYGANPYVTVPAGSVGVVTHTDLIAVTGKAWNSNSRKNNVLVSFQIADVPGRWTVELAPGEAWARVTTLGRYRRVLRCPRCRSEVWDGPKGYKLARCWNVHPGVKGDGTLAFDTMRENSWRWEPSA